MYKCSFAITLCLSPFQMAWVLLLGYQRPLATSTAKKMKKLLTQYNNGLPLDSQISWVTASHLQEQSYRSALTLSALNFIPHYVRYEAVQ